MLSAVGYASVQSTVRARRSRLLDDAAWRRLLDATSWTRAVATLDGTPYEASLEAPETAAASLRRRLYRETLDLADRVPERAGEAIRWFGDRFYVADLKLHVRALHYGRPTSDVDAASTLGPDEPRLRGVRSVRTVTQLVEHVGATPYGRALRNAFDRYEAEDRPFYLEVALDLAFGQGLVERIEALGGADAVDAERFLGRWLARSNLLAAARYRTLAGIRPEQVVGFCLHRDFGGGLASVQRLAAGGPLAEEAPKVDITLPTGIRGESAIRRFEHDVERLQRREAEARFSRSPFGLGIPLAYLFLLEAEVGDLVTILEGKTLGLPADDLVERLAREVH